MKLIEIVAFDKAFLPFFVSANWLPGFSCIITLIHISLQLENMMQHTIQILLFFFYISSISQLVQTLLTEKQLQMNYFHLFKTVKYPFSSFIILSICLCLLLTHTNTGGISAWGRRLCGRRELKRCSWGQRLASSMRCSRPAVCWLMPTPHSPSGTED